MEKKEIESWMERKAHNYTLEYKNWRFTLNEIERWNSFFVNIYYKDNSNSMYVYTGAKTVEEAKDRVEDFIKTELK
jgi:hypothetical protein